MFSFNAGSSSKPAPYRTTVTSLVDEYLTNTFLTRGDPLVVTPEHPGFVDWRRLYNSRASSVQYNSDVGTMATSIHSGGSAMATSVQYNGDVGSTMIVGIMQWRPLFILSVQILTAND